MKKTLISAAVLLSVSSISFAASQQSLTKEQTTQTFQDKTLTTAPMITMDKQIINNTMTAFFDKSGQVTGQLATKPSDIAQNDTGTWTVKPNGSVCVTWQQWNQHQPICVFVYSFNNTLLFINADTNNFESMVLKTNIKDGNQITTMPNDTTTTTTSQSNVQNPAANHGNQNQPAQANQPASNTNHS